MFTQPKSPRVSPGADAAVAKYKGKSTAAHCASAFISVDRQWCVTYWNKGAERIFNVQAGNILGKNLWEFFSTIIPIEFYGFYDRIFQIGASYQFSYFWVEINTWLEVCTFSEPEGFSISLKSLHSSETEEKDIQSQFLYPIYRFITESKQECLWNWKTDTGERYWIDGGLEKLFGYHIENTFLPHAFWENRIHPDDVDRVRTSILQFVQSNEHDWLLHYRFRNADGEYVPIYETGLKFYNEENRAEEVIGAMYVEGPKKPTESRNPGNRTRREKEITGAILTAQETERHDIGFKLNEDLNQILAIAKVYIQLSISNEVSRDVYLQKANTLIDQVITGIRNITEEILMPNSQLMGLFQNLETLCINNLTLHQLKTRFTHNGFEQQELDEAFQFGIFRIIQEQMREISACKGVQDVHIDLNSKGSKLILRISDNRQSADLTAAKEANGFINIQSRAGIFNGIASLQTEDDGRFVLKVIFPLEKKEKDSAGYSS
jgi:PAS domain-containing protein